MRIYDLVLILRDALPEDKRKKVIETVKVLLKDMKVLKEDTWGVKMFSYPIKREKSGFYHLLQLESEKGIATDFERRLIGNESILRHLLVRNK